MKLNISYYLTEEAQRMLIAGGGGNVERLQKIEIEVPDDIAAKKWDEKHLIGISGNGKCTLDNFVIFEDEKITSRRWNSDIGHYGHILTEEEAVKVVYNCIEDAEKKCGCYLRKKRCAREDAIALAVDKDEIYSRDSEGRFFKL